MARRRAAAAGSRVRSPTPRVSGPRSRDPSSGRRSPHPASDLDRAGRRRSRGAGRSARNRRHRDRTTHEHPRLGGDGSRHRGHRADDGRVVRARRVEDFAPAVGSPQPHHLAEPRTDVRAERRGSSEQDGRESWIGSLRVHRPEGPERTCVRQGAGSSRGMLWPRTSNDPSISAPARQPSRERFHVQARQRSWERERQGRGHGEREGQGRQRSGSPGASFASAFSAPRHAAGDPGRPAQRSPGLRSASVVARAPEAFGLRASSLLGDPALDRPPARSRGATRGWRRRDRGGEDLRHPLQGGLSVPKLRPLLRRRHRQHAIHEPAGKPIQRTPPLHGTQSARSGHIDAQLHAGVGRVDRLSAGSGRVAEPPAQLARRHQDRTADAERTDHAGSMNAGIAEPALSVSSPAS